MALAIGGMPKAKNRTSRRNLADLYNRLQKIMPLLEGLPDLIFPPMPRITDFAVIW